MADFRIYFIDARGRVTLGEAFSCDDEAEALTRLAAAAGQNARHVELWRGGRLVRRTSRSDPPVA